MVAWIIVGVFVTYQVLLMLILPGKTIKGPATPIHNNEPIHKVNGFSSFVITLLSYEVASGDLLTFIGAQLGAEWNYRLFPGSILFDHWLDLLGAFTWFSVGVCLLLYVKGIYFPSSSDSGSSGNLVFDFYWGTELYPKIKSLDIKPLIHSRIGITLWAMLNVSYVHAQLEHSGVITNALWVNAIMQLIYIGKHHWWEEGYMATTDIVHDYEGFYLVYGCVVFMPFTFTLSGVSLVYHPSHHLSVLGAIVSSILCLGFIYLNYSADDQKQRVRATDGNCTIWGRPPKVIRAKTYGYTKKASLLLCSGWWGVSRHFHYLADIGSVFLWTLPAGWPWENPIVYFYWVFLTILFIDRAKRDDLRCARKYKQSWAKYCSLVPYKIFPYIW
uniref:7-dehydrocholesterol reductase n=1 Tax=Vannella robusta TaxID=1487602 RepID=A0A6U1VU29_9EUKA